MIYKIKGFGFKIEGEKDKQVKEIIVLAESILTGVTNEITLKEYTKKYVKPYEMKDFNNNLALYIEELQLQLQMKQSYDLIKDSDLELDKIMCERYKLNCILITD